MSDTPPTDGRQRRLARAMAAIFAVVALALPFFWFTGAEPGSLRLFLIVEGLMLAPAWALFRYWRTGQDPEGYGKPLFGASGQEKPPPPQA